FVGSVGYSRFADVSQKGPSDWTSPPGEGRGAGGICEPTSTRPSDWIVDSYVARPVGAGPEMYVPLSLHRAPWKTSSKVRLVEHHATSLARPQGTSVEYPSITSTVPSAGCTTKTGRPSARFAGVTWPSAGTSTTPSTPGVTCAPRSGRNAIHAMASTGIVTAR